MDAPYKYLGSEPAIVDFWATWCGPCRALAPVLEQLSAETGITIYKVDVDQCGDLANMYNISYIPQLYYCANGKITPIENKDDNYSLASLKRIIGK
ncbi:MAG: thioredoxin family protein [Muribaculaceae bacterium]|nr:thioredoxin family protein [Muribaculaceae bacterium]MDE6321656.1 thioredoxin family protein [Muribaculaceae bacterium]